MAEALNALNLKYQEDRNMPIETVAEALKAHKSGEKWVEPFSHFNVITIYELFEKISGSNVTKLRILPEVYDATDDIILELKNESAFILDITENVKTDYTLNVIMEGEYEEEYEDEEEESEEEADYDFGSGEYCHNFDITLHFTGHRNSGDL